VIQDRLGSVGKYYPYGEERNSPQLPNDQVKFATYTRDSATGNDYADQRYYTSVLGRFMTADPSSASAGAADPASWNRYAYTRGDPVNRFDSFGTCDQSADTSTSITVCGTTDPVSGTAGSSIAGQGAPSNYLGPWVAQALATAAAVGNNYLASLQAGAIHYGSTSFDQAFTSLTSDLGDISAQFKNLQSADCEADLKAAGVTDAQVVAYAQGLSIVDGLGPAAITTTYAYAAYGNSLAYSSAATLWGGVTVAMYMAINLPGGVAAVAQAPGNTVYINAGWVNGMTTSQQEGMLVHELLHNITGIGDWDLQTALGLPHTVSQNIGDKLEKDCFQ
jgi:RHS repeat-associated protein